VKAITTMRPYSLDLRERLVAAVDGHDGSIRWFARIFRVSTSFIVRLLQRRRATGRLAPEPHRGGPSLALGPDDLERLAALVKERPDATLEQLKRRGGFSCSLKTLWYALDRLGLPMNSPLGHRPWLSIRTFFAGLVLDGAQSSPRPQVSLRMPEK
jgi:transposase